MPTVHCENINRKISLPEGGANLRELLSTESVRVFRCGNFWPFNRGKADMIEVISGEENLNSPTGKERSKLGLAAGKLRLAGQCKVRGDVTIHVRPWLSES